MIDYHVSPPLSHVCKVPRVPTPRYWLYLADVVFLFFFIYFLNLFCQAGMFATPWLSHAAFDDSTSWPREPVGLGSLLCPSHPSFFSSSMAKKTEIIRSAYHTSMLPCKPCKPWYTMVHDNLSGGRGGTVGRRGVQ